jgi:inosine-uridine nucleoside N-ribohydrolase
VKQLIIDTDPGNRVPAADVDDALAIAVALLAPDVTVLGLTTVAGNVELADATAGTLELLEVAGRTDVPVYEGAARPILADPDPIRRSMATRRESEQVRRIWPDQPRPLPTAQPGQRRAAEFIASTIMDHPGQVSLVALGPLTNVATAILLEPRLATAVREIVVMGGSVLAPGLWSPVTEYNAVNDPEALQIVLQSGAPITLVGLDVTLRTCLTLSDLERIRSVGTPLAEYLKAVTEPWIQFMVERRGLPGCWLHDPLAVHIALDPTIVRTEPMHVAVELASPLSRGQTIGWRPGKPYGVPGGEPNASVCLDLEEPRFMSLFLKALGVDT